MWMLYAQEHWTKAFDLKSEVERLYEELGALEFDADHEAIYGMERYYTVQQCEELRNKYKIGRKVMRTNKKINLCLSKESPKNVDAGPNSQRQDSDQWRGNIEHTLRRDNPEQINSSFKPVSNDANHYQQEETPHDQFTEPIQTQSSGRSCRQKWSKNDTQLETQNSTKSS
ncbi:hypothetical protein FQA39_LY15589 [Lamprigera yunnana]|nr:hypothetical protein FQA39_LY15589 [Lamprigera yunnana]